MKNFLLGMAVCAAAILTSCSSGDFFVRIDNPTDTAITVTVDGKEYTVEPNELIQFEGKKGDHTMIYNGEETKFDLQSNVMLNPTKATYVRVREEYGTGLASTANYVDINIDGKTYTGPFELHAGDPVISNRTTNYDVKTDFPKQVEMSATTSTVVKEKLFRLEDFLPYYKKEY